MNRWYVEKSGTGIEKSGTGIEKSGTGIEKSGTGIEKSGTGIEKSGTGLRKGLLALSMALCAFSSFANTTKSVDPAGALQVVVDNNKIAVSWIIDGSVFVGASSLEGTFANLSLTEVSIADPVSLEVVGGGTGEAKDVVGGGTGDSKDVVGGGTGESKNVVGGGTGIEVVGGGTGTEVVGGGTGTEVVGGGTGTEVVGGGTGTTVVGGGTGTDVVGGGTGESSEDSANSYTLVVGGGTGSDAISITLPGGTGLHMEVLLGCNTATVSVLDAKYAEVVTFENVQVIGDTGMCTDSGFDPRPAPGVDSQL